MYFKVLMSRISHNVRHGGPPEQDCLLANQKLSYFLYVDPD